MTAAPYTDAQSFRTTRLNLFEFALSSEKQTPERMREKNNNNNNNNNTVAFKYGVSFLVRFCYDIIPHHNLPLLKLNEQLSATAVEGRPSRRVFKVTIFYRGGDGQKRAYVLSLVLLVFGVLDRV